jgi:choline-sulfatase
VSPDAADERSARLSPRSRRRLIPFWALAATLGCGADDGSTGRAPQPPNVLIFLVDALRADALGAYGNEIVETPAIDRFAREGAVFEQAFAQSSWTRPSVTSILTGLHPSVHGVETRKDTLSPALTSLPEVFREHGYRTGILLTNPNVGAFFGYSRGFDDFIELYGRREGGRVSSRELVASSDQVVDRAREWLADVPEPFFLIVFTADPHAPYEPPPRFNRYLDPNESDPRRGLYHGEVSFADDSFGRLMSYLDDRGLSERTITVLTSDHGEEFLEHGQVGHGKALYEESLHVPLIVRWPREIEPGRRVDAPVQLMDLMETLLGLARLPVPQPQDGRPLFREPREPAPLFANLKLDGRDQWSVRHHPWKLILDRTSGEAMLFDLSSDSGEMRDLSGDHPERVRELREWIAERIESDVRRRAMLQNQEPSRTIGDEELPEDTRDALRALGYIK